MVGREVGTKNLFCESFGLTLKRMGGGGGMLRAPRATWRAGGGLGGG